MSSKLCMYIAILVLSIWSSHVNGCHNALDGGTGRKKRQATRFDNNVQRTRTLRDFFSTCLMDQAGPLFDWEGVVDFSILDTLWYEVTNEETCTNDTVLCWQNRLEAYLRPNSAVLPFARECIRQLGEDVQAGRFGEGRSKRSYQHSSYYPTTTTQSPEDFLMDRYSTCVRNQLVLPRNRRKLNVKSVVDFVEENAICGECSEIREPTYTPHYHTSNYHFQGRSKRSVVQSSSYKNGASSIRSLISSLAFEFLPIDLTAHYETECISADLYPYVFQGLTLRSSPLFNPITTCNQIFRDDFLPSDPCEGLKNRKQDSFCEEQQSWCIHYPNYMNATCEKSCCERMNLQIIEDDLPNIGWTEWTPWGACPAPCDRTATQVRKRCCPLGVAGVAPCSGEARETRQCRPEGCSFWSDWSPWSSCDVTCGSQRQTSQRKCNGGSECRGMSSRVKMCSKGRCPGMWTQWASWSECTVTCGGYDTYIHRSRSCLEGRVGELGCEGSDSERRECGRDYCRPRPQWSDWTSWSECSYKRRARYCIGGPQESCEGDSIVYERCEGCRQQSYTPPTTTHQVHHSITRYATFAPPQSTFGHQQTSSWSQWSQWSTCEGHNCLNGVKRRHRECRQGRGNSSCNGQSSESMSCTTTYCYFLANKLG